MKSVIILSLLISACGNMAGAHKSEPPTPAAPQVAMPTIYNFSGDFCMPCKSQAKMWVNYLGGVNSTKVKIVTHVIDLQPNEIPEYVSKNKIPWEVKSDVEKLFRKYCTGSNAAVPCNMVVVDDKIVYLKAAAATPQSLEKYTGSWK